MPAILGETMFSSWKRLASVVAVLALALACGAGTVAAKKPKCPSHHCGTYAGSTSDATDPVGNTSSGGPFGFVVKPKGVVALTAQGTWNCSHNGSDIAPEPYTFDRTFKGRPIKVKANGKFAGDRYFGDLHMSVSGRINKKGKFSGYFALGFLNGTDGCGTATMPATAKKK